MSILRPELRPIVYDKTLLFRSLPQLIHVRNNNILLKPDGPYKHSEINPENNWCLLNLAITHKLSAVGIDESSRFEAGWKEKRVFKTREDFDEAVLKKAHRVGQLGPNHAWIPLRDTFKLIGINFKVNKIHDNDPVKENEIFNNEMIRLYGGDTQDDVLDAKTNVKICMIKNFYVISVSNSYIIATAERGDHYLFFGFCR